MVAWTTSLRKRCTDGDDQTSAQFTARHGKAQPKVGCTAAELPGASQVPGSAPPGPALTNLRPRHKSLPLHSDSDQFEPPRGMKSSCVKQLSRKSAPRQCSGRPARASRRNLRDERKRTQNERNELTRPGFLAFPGPSRASPERELVTRLTPRMRRKHCLRASQQRSALCRYALPFCPVSLPSSGTPRCREHRGAAAAQRCQGQDAGATSGKSQTSSCESLSVLAGPARGPRAPAAA